MSNEQFIKQWMRYLDTWMKKDMELADRLTDELITPDAVWHIPGMTGVEPGSEGQKKFAREMITNNPDFRIQIDEFLSDGDKIAGRGTFYMNNSTTKAVESSVFLEIDRLADGKIAESWTLLVPGKWKETAAASVSEGVVLAKDIKAKYLHYVETWNNKEVEQMDRLTDELMSENAIWHWPGGDPGQGTAGQKAFVRETIANNPDFKFSINNLLFDGDKMIIRGTALMNNPTTGAVESIVFLEIDRIVKGKMAESWTLSAPGKW